MELGALVFFCFIVIVGSKNVLDMRIINGQTAYPTEVPYHVGLVIHYSCRADWCGGALISNKHILTTASCLNKAYFCFAYFGSDPISKRDEHMKITRHNFIIHQNFNQITYQNDIALIKTPVTIEFSKYVHSAYIPNSFKRSFSGEKALTSGWGTAGDELEELSKTLRYVITDVISNVDCNRLVGKFEVMEGHICIFSNGSMKTTCDGDSGGPLVVPYEGKPLIIGINSLRSSEKCEVNAPVIFTRISSYSRWIEEKSGVKGI